MTVSIFITLTSEVRSLIANRSQFCSKRSQLHLGDVVFPRWYLEKSGVVYPDTVVEVKPSKRIGVLPDAAFGRKELERQPGYVYRSRLRDIVRPGSELHDNLTALVVAHRLKEIA